MLPLQKHSRLRTQSMNDTGELRSTVVKHTKPSTQCAYQSMLVNERTELWLLNVSQLILKVVVLYPTILYDSPRLPINDRHYRNIWQWIILRLLKYFGHNKHSIRRNGGDELAWRCTLCEWNLDLDKSKTTLHSSFCPLQRTNIWLEWDKRLKMYKTQRMATVSSRQKIQWIFAHICFACFRKYSGAVDSHYDPFGTIASLFFCSRHKSRSHLFTFDMELLHHSRFQLVFGFVFLSSDAVCVCANNTLRSQLFGCGKKIDWLLFEFAHEKVNFETRSTWK